MPSRTIRTEVKGWPRNKYGCQHPNFMNANWGCWDEEELITEPLS